MQISVAAILAAVMLVALIFGGFSIGKNSALAEEEAARAALSVVEPNLIVRPDTVDYVFSILCDAEASDSFLQEDEQGDEHSRHHAMRNAHLVEETGAWMTEATVTSVYDAAVNDVLSGSYTHAMYAGDAAGTLSHLLGAGILRDVSDSQYIRTKDAWFDGSVMESLSLFGGQYFISSAAADARRSISVLVYNRAHHDFADSLTSAALNGTFTVERLLLESRAAEAVGDVPPVAETEAAVDLVVDLTEEERFHGIGYGREDVFALYVAVGGSFWGQESVSLSAMRTALDRLFPLFADATVVERPDGFAEGETLFTVATLAEANDFARRGVDVGILPLPKADAADAYRAYLDPRGAIMLALPKGAPAGETAEYMIYRMAFLSKGYIEPCMYEELVGEREEERKLLSLIFDHMVCDLSGLLGYGDIESLVAEAALDGDARLALHYYNRKTLYEKALSILEKRLTKEE